MWYLIQESWYKRPPGPWDPSTQGSLGLEGELCARGLASVAAIVIRGKTKCHLSSWLYRCRGMSRRAREGNNIDCLLWQELSPSLLVHALLCWFISYAEFPCTGCGHIGGAEYMAFDVGQVLALWGLTSPPSNNCILFLHNFAYWNSSNLPNTDIHICKTKKMHFKEGEA